MAPRRRRSGSLAWATVITLSLGWATPARAQSGGPGQEVRPTAPGANPARPPEGASPDDENPDQGNPHQANPHQAGSPHGTSGGGGGGGGEMGVFQATADSVEPEAKLPVGSISIDLVDPLNHPLPNVDVTLGIVQNSVAKGESREHRVKTADGAGHVSFEGLTVANAMAYRVSVAKDGGSFAASPFNLPRDRGMHVVLHVYPVSRELLSIENFSPGMSHGRPVVIVEGVVYAEVKDDRIQMQQLFRIVNAGDHAWVPSDYVLALPEGFTALSGIGQQMSDVGIDATDKGARLRGTFGPGKHELTFQWQLPYSGSPTVDFDLPLPTNTVSLRIMAPASQEMRLVADDFPPAENQTDGQGQHVLITEKQLKRGDALLKHVKFKLLDIPVQGPARVIATVLAALGVLAGLRIAYRGRARALLTTLKKDAKAQRSLLLAELEELELARRAGDVGPKTYERARRQLVDAIARTLAKESGSLPPSGTAAGAATG